MYQKDSQEIAHIINEYFQGIFQGDTERLRAVFHPQALLLGDVKGESYFKHVAEYIEGVRHRKSPNALGNPVRSVYLEIRMNVFFIKENAT